MKQTIGKSQAMLEISQLIERVAPTDSSILIYGENGTGKELIAQAIHEQSCRKGKPFVVQNCSAFNDNLLDSELFGHVKGSFTGAVRDKKGLFEVADGGTFFLDEVGDMSPSLQVKILRVLQEGTLTSVGDTKLKKVDVRIIAATNRNLAKMVKEGKFREDLFYRLNVIHISIPPLRDRRGDIPALLEHFLSMHAKKTDQRKSVNPEVMEALAQYHWPGNVRELENEVERMVVMAGNRDLLAPADLSDKFKAVSAPSYHEMGRTDLSRFKTHKGLKKALEALEKEMIEDGLKRLRWNKSTLARELGISRVSLIKKVEKYKLERRRAFRN